MYVSVATFQRRQWLKISLQRLQAHRAQPAKLILLLFKTLYFSNIRDAVQTCTSYSKAADMLTRERAPINAATGHAQTAMWLHSRDL